MMFNHSLKINKILFSINHDFFFVFLATFFCLLVQPTPSYTQASKYNKKIQLCKNESINYGAIQFFPDHISELDVASRRAAEN